MIYSHIKQATSALKALYFCKGKMSFRSFNAMIYIFKINYADCHFHFSEFNPHVLLHKVLTDPTDIDSPVDLFDRCYL